jgi:hypothetical protein
LRWRARRRSSSQPLNTPTMRELLDRLTSVAEENMRPSDNCVESTAARKKSVRMTMIDPVRFRYSAIHDARPSPTYPPARNGLPPASTLPKARLSSELRQPKSSTAPTSFVYCASTLRHQK